MLLKWQIEETFFFVFFGDKVRARHRTDGKNKGLSVCLDLGRLVAQLSYPRDIIQNLFSFIYISILPRNYEMDENITQQYSQQINVNLRDIFLYC